MKMIELPLEVVYYGHRLLMLSGLATGFSVSSSELQPVARIDTLPIELGLGLSRIGRLPRLKLMPEMAAYGMLSVIFAMARVFILQTLATVNLEVKAVLPSCMPWDMML
ncbi:hypothetical protein Nepgr_013455 [Nepenthes gracilis]|uniref:Uncharacterized protein n=1 Tax=Nepenthes gracilis TaxID=150966 RepID=A0AAD3SJ90_NEPGR|nr:hypothetical protein Nepgr_013455 [Nepenthes gracilis]